MKQPLVSIIVPCYNGERHVRKLLDSILGQHYRAIELIVVNDGSTDKTADILQDYKPKFEKKNIQYVIISQSNGGLPNAVNAGLKKFSGEYLNFIDHDDYLTPDSIQKRVDFLEKNKDIDVVWAATNVVDESGMVVHVWRENSNPPRTSLFEDMILDKDYKWVSASKMVRASAFLEVYPNRHILDRVPGQNIQIFLPLYYKGNNVGYIDEPLAYVTARSDSDSRRRRDDVEMSLYQLGIRDTYLDTLKKIDMPQKERDKYMSIIMERYKKYEKHHPKPLVSIIVPCYNGEKYVKKLLDSVLAQDYEKIELVAVDDGSTDKTLDILASYKPKFKARKFRYIIVSKKNGGVTSAINVGLKKFTGDYFNLIGCDDYLAPGSIRKRVEFLERNKNLDIVWAPLNIVNEDGDIVDVWRESVTPPRSSMFMDMLLGRRYVWQPSTRMVRASAFLKVNPKRDILESAPGESIQIFLPIYHRGNNVGYIDEPLAYVTQRPDSVSRKFRNEQQESEWQLALRDTFIDTLRKIDMPGDERDEYIRLVTERFKQYEQDAKRVLYRVVSDKDELGQLYDYDERKFRQSYVADVNTANQRQLAAKLVFASHSMEKSLSNDKFEAGHGFRVAARLIRMLKIYKEKKYDRNHLAYINTLSVLRAFYDRHKETGFKSEIEGIFGDMLAEIKACKFDIGGSDEVLLKDKLNNDKKNFKELAEGRFTVRTYADRPVDKKDIAEVVEIAMKTPTVCNRQSLHVHAIYKKEIIEKVLEVQGGLAYYDTPPVLLLITADDNGYVGPNERNQGFVDGGLFAMSILYALEYKKLAACPAHAMLTELEEMTVRGMLGISDSEKFVTFITVGHFKEKNQVCKSFRYPVEYVLSEKDRLYDYEIRTVEESPVSDPQPPTSTLWTIRRKLRPRTRILNALRRVKHATRVRTRARRVLARASAYAERRKLKRADGAILTLTGYFNYGNVLQRYALQKFLRQNGHNFVSYTDSHSGAVDISRIDKNQAVTDVYPNARGKENIINFVRKHIITKPFDPTDNYKNYIVGSDQVWRNWWAGHEALGYYFLDFLKGKKANRIAYAASFGKDKIDEIMSRDDVGYVRPLIKRFNAILVREKSAAKVIERTWGLKNAKVVADPTLLLDKSDYSELIEQSDAKNEKINPIFAYVLGETDAVVNFIQRVSKDRMQSVTKIRAHKGSENDVLPPVELWLKGFRDAELAITNSYHGMLFSILNHTDFIIIGKEIGGLSRIQDFLSECGIQDRFVDETDLETFDPSKLQPIDWERVHGRLAKMVKESGALLIKAVEGGR